MEKTKSTTDLFKEVQEMVQTCIQCGTCSGSCLAAPFMELTPRAIWRRVQLGLKEDVLNSKSFVYCASCYYCTLRCPRGLPLTQAMSKLKEISVKSGMKQHKSSTDFYSCFVKSICRHGRVNEVEMMTHYFWESKNPLMPMGYLPLGVKLMQKRKLSLGNKFKGTGVLENLFTKVRQMETRP